MMDSMAIRRRVVVAWDGSPASTVSFSVADAIARQAGAEVEAVYVATDADDWNGRGFALLDEAKRRGNTLRLATGEPAEEILRISDDAATLLIVLTSHGREIEAHHRIGGVTAKVLARAKRPAMIVPPESVECPGAVDRLLAPMDGTAKTAQGLRALTDLALALGAGLDLLYVVAQEERGSCERRTVGAPRYLDQPQHEWPAWAEEAMHRLANCCGERPQDIAARIWLARGDPAQETVRFAEEHDTGAIVLVRRSRFEQDRARVIRSVLGWTHRPVIIVGGEEA